MNDIKIKLCEISTKVLPIGFEGEQNSRRVIFDASELFTEYPSASASLTVKPPVGNIYPKATTRDGNNIIWEIAASDCANDGDGEYQLTFTQGEAVRKTWNGFTKVYGSLSGSGSAPTPVEDWIEDAQAALNALEYLSASASSLPYGSPATAEMTEVDGHKNIAIGVPAGAPGQDGVSPSITITDITGGHRVIVVDANGTHTFDVMDGLTEPLTRVISLDATELACGTQIESVGTPVYVDDVTDYPTYNLTDTGWYIFARITAKEGVKVSAQTSVTGVAGVVATVGASYVDVAVRFEVAAVSKKVTVTWASGNTEVFVFKATDLAVRNLDYRTTFYIYDIAPYATWAFGLTTDETFQDGKNYYTESGGVYTLATVTTGETIPADTYYVHTKITFSGMVRNVTYRLNEMIDCPIEIVLPEVPDDGYGAWFEIQMQYNAEYSTTLTPTDPNVVIGTANTQGQNAGINVVDLTYSKVNNIAMWTLLNTHSNLPAAS